MIVVMFELARGRIGMIEASTTRSPSTPMTRAWGSTTRPIAVSSWWKLGAGPGDLEIAERKCLSRLGVIHRPDPGSDIVTAGMYSCLRAQGWYGIVKR